MPGTEVIIVGAGQGRRMGALEPKVFLTLGPRPVLAHAVGAFTALAEISGVVLVVPAGAENRARAACRDLPGAEKIRAILPGGEHRQDSVRAGLRSLPSAAETILVHDGARPFISSELILRVVAAARQVGAAVPGLAVADTLKETNSERRVVRTLGRTAVVAVQTPQGFQRDVLLRAYAWAAANPVSATDDAGLVEASGGPVAVVAGEPENFKLTTPWDFSLAEMLWEQRDPATRRRRRD
jgi:2-C-methyl-D-erythritol 4-phosphate cytidylyltransferase